MKTKLKVCGHRVLVRIDDELALSSFKKDLKEGEELRGNEVFTKSGMFVRKVNVDLDRERRGAESGLVLQVGGTAYKDFGGEPWCEVGDRVFFVRYEGREIRSEEIGEPHGVSYRVLNDDDIVAVLK